MRGQTKTKTTTTPSGTKYHASKSLFKKLLRLIMQGACQESEHASGLLRIIPKLAVKNFAFFRSSIASHMLPADLPPSQQGAAKCECSVCALYLFTTVFRPFACLLDEYQPLGRENITPLPVRHHLSTMATSTKTNIIHRHMHVNVTHAKGYKNTYNRALSHPPSTSYTYAQTKTEDLHEM